MPFGVYIHIPFCVKKCDYCAFSSRASSSPPEKRYVDAVLTELKASAPLFPERPLFSLYIGGGTPSLFSPKSIERLLQGVREFFSVRSDRQEAEITLEVNPGAVDTDRLAGYRDAGVNRVSLGIQSLRDRRLQFLGRIHSAVQAYESFSHAHKAGFANINVDMIFGTTGHDAHEWEEELGEAASLRPHHISVYELTIEKGTPLWHRAEEDSRIRPDEDTLASLHLATRRVLSESGYEHYEVSNYSLPGFRSRHNENYWARGEYLGLGAGAHSFIEDRGGESGGKRWWNTEDPREYMASVRDSGAARKGEESLTNDQAMMETVFLALRRTEGLDMDDFALRFGKTPLEAFPGAFQLIERGFLLLSGKKLVLTSEAVLLSDRILSELIFAPQRKSLTLF